MKRYSVTSLHSQLTDVDTPHIAGGIHDEAITPSKLKDYVAGLNGESLGIKSDGSGFEISAGGIKYITSDLIENSMSNSSSDITIGNVTIPANTVSTGILIFASVMQKVSGAGYRDVSSFKVKVGAPGSELEKEVLTLGNVATGAGDDSRIGGFLLWYETGQTWTNDISVIITGANGSANSHYVCYCNTLVVVGV